MDFSKFFVVKHNSQVFEPGTIVELKYLISANNYCVKGISNDISTSENIMKCDLYPVVPKDGFYHIEKWQSIANAFIAKSQG
jgi:hypothetical protein